MANKQVYQGLNNEQYWTANLGQQASNVNGYGAEFMFQTSTPYGKNIGIADQCLTEAQKCDKAEADFMSQPDEDVDLNKINFGTAIVPADHFMRLQCLKIAEKQTGLMANEVLDYAKTLYDFVTAKEGTDK